MVLEKPAATTVRVATLEQWLKVPGKTRDEQRMKEELRKLLERAKGSEVAAPKEPLPSGTPDSSAWGCVPKAGRRRKAVYHRATWLADLGASQDSARQQHAISARLRP